MLHADLFFMTRICQTRMSQPLPLIGELIDGLAHPGSEDPEPLIIGEPEFLRPVISYETAQQHLTELIRYFTMFPIHEIEVPFSRTPFKITTGVSQPYRLKEVIGHQHENQKKQSDLTKWFTVTTGGTSLSHAALQLPSHGELEALEST